MTASAGAGSPGAASPADASPQAALQDSPERRALLDAIDALPPPLRCDAYTGAMRAVLHFVYDAAWVLAAALGSPWLVWKACTTPGFARMCRERLGAGLGGPPADGRECVLVHGVSVGEVKAAAVLVQALREAHPDRAVVVSASTDTGMEVARALFEDLRVVRFPLDLSPVVRRFFHRVRPAAVVLVELEVWPNFLRHANRRGVPVAVVNGRITGKSHGQYRFFRRQLPQFNRISLYCVQAEEYARRFRDLSVDPTRMVVTGNVKFDGRAVGRCDPGEELRRLLGGAPGQRLVVAGSTHGPEERAVVQAWRAGAPDARLVVVPRHPQRAAELCRELAEVGPPPQRLTLLRAGEVRPDPSRPVLVDTIGELERVYGLADLVFVGGSLLPHGGHNVLEPAAQGVPVLTGPHVQNFQQEVALLEAHGACRRVEDGAALGAALGELLGDEAAIEAMGRAGCAAVEAQGGATQLTLRALERVLLTATDGPPAPAAIT